MMNRHGTRLFPPAAALVDEDPLGKSFWIQSGDVVVFHRVHGCDETWTLLEGGALEVHLIHSDGRHETRVLRLDDPARSGGSTTVVEAGSLRAARLAPGAARAALRRAVTSGRWPEGIEVPRAADILRRHPLHRGIVHELAAG